MYNLLDPSGALADVVVKVGEPFHWLSHLSKGKGESHLWAEHLLYTSSADLPACAGVQQESSGCAGRALEWASLRAWDQALRCWEAAKEKTAKLSRWKARGEFELPSLDFQSYTTTVLLSSLLAGSPRCRWPGDRFE